MLREMEELSERSGAEVDSRNSGSWAYLELRNPAQKQVLHLYRRLSGLSLIRGVRIQAWTIPA